MRTLTVREGMVPISNSQRDHPGKNKGGIPSSNNGASTVFPSIVLHKKGIPQRPGEIPLLSDELADLLHVSTTLS